MGQNPIAFLGFGILTHHFFRVYVYAYVLHCVNMYYNHDQYPLSLITHSFMTLLMLPTAFLTTKPSVPVPGAVQHKTIYVNWDTATDGRKTA